jgi:hypothetical protein
MYKRCARQYEYRYIQDLKKAPGIALLKGKSVHKGVEVTHTKTILTGFPLTYEEAVQAVVDEFKSGEADIEDWEDSKPGVLQDDAIRNFKVYYNQAVPVINPVKVENPFTVKIGTVPVRGIIDLVDRVLDPDMSLENDPENPKKIEVVSDLKTAERVWPGQRIERDPQLTFYAIAEQTDKVRIDFLLDQKSGTRYEPKRSVRRATEKRILIEDVEEMVDLVKKGVFPRCETSHFLCIPKYCGFYERCRGPK